MTQSGHCERRNLLPVLRLPLPRQLFGLGYLGRGHPLGNDIAVLDRFIAALAGGESIVATATAGRLVRQSRNWRTASLVFGIRTY